MSDGIAARVIEQLVTGDLLPMKALVKVTVRSRWLASIEPAPTEVRG